MIASVHITDVGVVAALAALRKTHGLRHANLGFAKTLDSVPRAPTWGRLGLVALWDDDAALDHFLQEHPLARLLASGFRVRLKPLRASGSWPGLPGDLPTTRQTHSEGPVAVLTLGRLRLTQAPRFLRASARTEASMSRAGGLIWATGLGLPPFVCTFSLWQDARSLVSYAYGHADPAHREAVQSAAAKPFHHESAFIRLQPYAAEGQLAGTNPIAASAWMSGVVRAAE